MTTQHDFTALIEPLIAIAAEAQQERGVPAAVVGFAMLGAAKGILVVECGPTVAAGALMAALDALRQEHPAAVNEAADAVSKAKSNSGLQ